MADEKSLTPEQPARPREGWAEAARRMHLAGDDRLLDRPVATRFDQVEWEWE
jgi:hypothetical protein